MFPEADLPSARPKVFRVRLSSICMASVFFGVVGTIATLASAAYCFFEWSSTSDDNQLVHWVGIVVSGLAALLFAYLTFSWQATCFSNLGKKLTLTGETICLEKGRKMVCHRWEEISSIDRDERLDSHSNSDGIFLALIQHHVGWLVGSSITLRFADRDVMVVSAFFERYDEICGRIQRKYRRSIQEREQENDDSVSTPSN